LCQWGSQRWANDGKDHGWMADHYYLGATLLGPLIAERLDDAGTLGMESGEVLTVELMWENQGSLAWSEGTLHLQTLGPEGRTSEFSATWESLNRAASLEDDIRPGEVGILALTLVAPEVEEEQRFDEQLGLYSSDLDAWVPDDGVVDLVIKVYPAGELPDSGIWEDTGRRDPAALPGKDDAEDKAGCSCGGGAAGTLLGLPWLLWGLWRRRA
jgi:hypothetical protein